MSNESLTETPSTGGERPPRRPLDGVTVVEVASWVAAPSAGAMMSDLGAEVIKIEPPGGDPYRGMMRPPKIDDGEGKGFDASFHADNRGKRSAVIDITKVEGAELVQRLVAHAEVFVCNMLPSRQQRFGFDTESLRLRNPRLVHATLTGYGTAGDEADRPGYDVTAFFGRGAISNLAGSPLDGSPPTLPPAMGDHTTGLAFLASILAGLRLAEHTGEFQVVEASLLGTAVWAIASDVSISLIDRHQPRRRNRYQQVNALNNAFPTADDRWLVVNMPAHSWWPRFCDAIAAPELAADQRFATGKSRYRNMAELIDRVDAIMVTRTADEWGRIFDEHGLIWGPTQTVPELVDDPQARANDLFPPLDPDGSTGLETVASPVQVIGADVRPDGPAPEVGADTDTVLGRLGIEGADLERLRAEGVVA